MNYMEEAILLKIFTASLWVGVKKINKRPKQEAFLKTKTTAR